MSDIIAKFSYFVLAPIFCINIELIAHWNRDEQAIRRYWACMKWKHVNKKSVNIFYIGRSVTDPCIKQCTPSMEWTCFNSHEMYTLLLYGPLSSDVLCWAQWILTIYNSMCRHLAVWLLRSEINTLIYGKSDQIKRFLIDFSSSSSVISFPQMDTTGFGHLIFKLY